MQTPQSGKRLGGTVFPMHNRVPFGALTATTNRPSPHRRYTHQCRLSPYRGTTTPSRYRLHISTDAPPGRRMHPIGRQHPYQKYRLSCGSGSTSIGKHTAVAAQTPKKTTGVSVPSQKYHPPHYSILNLMPPHCVPPVSIPHSEMNTPSGKTPPPVVNHWKKIHP